MIGHTRGVLVIPLSVELVLPCLRQHDMLARVSLGDEPFSLICDVSAIGDELFDLSTRSELE